jgi:hypothetical protein
MPVSHQPVAVSVILPLFGDHRGADALPAVCHAWLAQELPCEVVIALADGTRLPPLGDGVSDGRIRIVAAARDSVSPGPLRNLAVLASAAPVLYLSDADVAPLGGDFLTRALELGADQAVIQPWMYRLVNPSQAVRPGPVSAAPFQRPGGGRVCHVSVDEAGQLGPAGRERERFTWLSPDLLEVRPPSGIGWYNEDGTPWRAFPFHWGGILVRRETFDAVGGYCTRYSGWGCEDDDLIAKLEGKTGIVRAWKVAARQLACLHFEHSRSHTFTHITANQAILRARVTAGIDAMIEEDAR